MTRRGLPVREELSHRGCQGGASGRDHIKNTPTAQHKSVGLRARLDRTHEPPDASLHRHKSKQMGDRNRSRSRLSSTPTEWRGGTKFGPGVNLCAGCPAQPARRSRAAHRYTVARIPALALGDRQLSGICVSGRPGNSSSPPLISLIPISRSWLRFGARGASMAGAPAQ